MVLLVHVDARYSGGTERALYEEFGVRGVVDDVYVLVAQLTHYAVHAASLHSHARSHGVDALVVALHSHLCSLARHACYLTDGNESVGYLGHLSLEQTLEEHRACARKDNLGVVVLVVHTVYDCPDGLALVIGVVRYLLHLWQDELVVLVVHHEHLALPHLIHLTGNDLSDAVLILII